MPRRPRTEYPNAVHHVTARGDRHEAIFEDDVDRYRLLDIVSEALLRFDAHALAFCLMGNHFHFVLRTPQANLSKVMQHVNGVYTRSFNKRHAQSGHVFQGRYHDVLVESDAYLLALCAYVERNPVRAGLVARAVEWRWSSFRCHIGLDKAPQWLESAVLLQMLFGRDLRDVVDRQAAIERYESLVDSTLDAPDRLRKLRNGLLLPGVGPAGDRARLSSSPASSPVPPARPSRAS